MYPKLFSLNTCLWMVLLKNVLKAGTNQMFETFSMADCLKLSHWSFQHSDPLEEQRDLQYHYVIGRVPASHHAFSLSHSEMVKETGSGDDEGVGADALYSGQREQEAYEQLGESLHLKIRNFKCFTASVNDIYINYNMQDF